MKWVSHYVTWLILTDKPFYMSLLWFTDVYNLLLTYYCECYTVEQYVEYVHRLNSYIHELRCILTSKQPVLSSSLYFTPMLFKHHYCNLPNVKINRLNIFNAHSDVRAAKSTRVVYILKSLHWLKLSWTSPITQLDVHHHVLGINRLIHFLSLVCISHFMIHFSKHLSGHLFHSHHPLFFVLSL